MYNKLIRVFILIFSVFTTGTLFAESPGYIIFEGNKYVFVGNKYVFVGEKTESNMTSTLDFTSDNITGPLYFTGEKADSNIASIFYFTGENQLQT